MKKTDFIELTKGLENYDSETIARFIQASFSSRFDLFKEKDKNYGGSWQKDGQIGAFLNLKRKIDRLLNIWQMGGLFDVEESAGETVIDTYLDMINYAEMNLALMFLKADEATYYKFLEAFPQLGKEFYFNIENKATLCKK